MLHTCGAALSESCPRLLTENTMYSLTLPLKGGIHCGGTKEGTGLAGVTIESQRGSRTQGKQLKKRAEPDSTFRLQKGPMVLQGGWTALNAEGRVPIYAPMRTRAVPVRARVGPRVTPGQWGVLPHSRMTKSGPKGLRGGASNQTKKGWVPGPFPTCSNAARKVLPCQNAACSDVVFHRTKTWCAKQPSLATPRAHTEHHACQTFGSSRTSPS